MIHRTSILLFLLSVPFLISTSTFAQDKKKESSDQKSKWKLQKSYEELKEITQKAHDPILDVEELKIFLKPGVYDGTVKMTMIKSDTPDHPKTAKKTELERIKYVDGKYIVYKTESQNGINWSVMTFDKSCNCYRIWSIDGGKIFYFGIGNRIENERMITWSQKNLNTDKQHMVNGYQIISKDRTSERGKYTIVFDERTYIHKVEYSFKKSLSEKYKNGKKE